MALKFKYGKREEIPGDQGALYVEREGAFYLDVEGVVERAKLEEFRANNIKLAQEFEAHKKRFEGIDPEAVKKLADEKAALEAQLKSGSGKDIDQILTARLKPLQDSLAAITAERERLNRELQTKQVSEAVLTEAQKRGLRASAHEDILLRAGRSVRAENGVLCVVDAAGQKRYGADGVSPLTLDAWIAGLATEAPHLFETNAGGGATGNGSGGAGNGVHVNPWKKETFNLTMQGQIMTKDPARAAALKAAAGVR